MQSGEPKERGKSFYADQTSQLDAGVLECEPNKHVIEAVPFDGFVYLLEGWINVINGDVEIYKAGDSFMMPGAADAHGTSRNPCANSMSC
jgi:uncharacterized cupin superfamily protein